MAKRDASGYLVMSPRGKRVVGGGVTMYDVKLQQSPDDVIDVVGFGDETFKQVKVFSDSKSPVKIQLFPPGAGFTREVIRQRSGIFNANRNDVPFDYAPHLFEGDSSSEAPNMANVKYLLDHSTFNKDALHTVRGKLSVGGKVPKHVGSLNKKVKDDIMFFDKTGHIQLSVFEPLITAVKNEQMVELICVKQRKWDDENIKLTTTPFTQINVIPDDPEILIPKEFVASGKAEETLHVNRLTSVRNFTRYSACEHCQRKIPDNAIRSKAFDCHYCQESFRIAELISTFVVHVKINEDEYTIPGKVVAELLGEGLSEVEIRDELLDLEEFDITFNKNKMISSLGKK